jgi:hypothetical protein
MNRPPESGRAWSQPLAKSSVGVRSASSTLPTCAPEKLRIYDLTHRWDSGVPSWFAAWVDLERRASSLCWWEPLLVPGLLQTEDYARALFEAWRLAGGEDLDQLVQGRMERQLILERPEPPSLWAILDEAVLRRCIGSEEIMYDQLMHLVDMAAKPKITIQVMPLEVGAHVGLLGAFAIADVNGARIVYMESPNQGQTTELPSVAATVSAVFDTLRAEALPRMASRELIRRVAEEQWTS